jgi:hypothetical protein
MRGEFWFRSPCGQVRGKACGGLGGDARRPVSRVLSAPQVSLRCGTTIPLGRASRRASRDLPGRRSGNAPVPCGTAAPIRSCTRWGLPCRPCCQGRGALLPHRFALACGIPCGSCAGGLFSVALSLGSPPPAVSRHRFPVEPGLSSDTPGLAWRDQRPSDRLAAHDMCEKRQESKKARVHTEDAESTEHHRERMNALRAKHALGLDPRAPFSSSVPPSWFSVLSV